MPLLLATAVHSFEHPDVGTPPFTFGLLLRSTIDAPTTSPDDMLGVLHDSYQTNVRPALWSGLSTGLLTLTVESSAGETVNTVALDAPSGSGETNMPGTSMRIIFDAARPFKARNNCCYWPLPTAGSVNVEGVVQSAALADAVAWGSDILTGFSGFDFEWVAKHQIGGHSATPTYVPVTSTHSAPTASFLQRRYR